MITEEEESWWPLQPDYEYGANRADITWRKWHGPEGIKIYEWSTPRTNTHLRPGNRYVIHLEGRPSNVQDCLQCADLLEVRCLLIHLYEERKHEKAELARARAENSQVSQAHRAEQEALFP